ncbi:GrdX protein [Drancourtella sp. An210]|uniref:GrdX family protein n=1 Tax=Sellimonas sp. TaxID=2021466 RepID=UPI000B367824|nr:GrdX protein [Drancourtella sp. An210]
MKKDFRIITNNPLVLEKLGDEYQVEYYEISYEDVLEKVRDEVYKGYRLLTHPLSGSVKPNETPYKSVMVSVSKSGADPDGMKIIENAIAACKKFEFKSDKYKPQVYEDFRLIDYTLISSALPSAEAW